MQKYGHNDDAGEHFLYCQQQHLPYITLTQKHRDYVEVFYDITDFKVDLAVISDKLKSILISYYELNLVPYYEYQHYLENYYFFNFIIKVEHADCMANLLFDFLCDKTSNG